MAFSLHGTSPAIGEASPLPIRSLIRNSIRLFLCGLALIHGRGGNT